MIPGSANPLLLASAAEAGAYEIERSLRFNSSDSAYLGETFGTPTDQDVFTLSMWVKRSALGSTQQLFGVSTNHSFGFTSGDALNLTFGGSSALTTTALFRDPSAWYHVVWEQNGTAHELYVNNVSVGTATATSNTFNTAVAHQIAAANTTNYFNGYLADIHFIDGQALDPTSFGEFDDNGIWQPKAFTGSYDNLLKLPSSTITTSGTPWSSTREWDDFFVNTLSDAVYAATGTTHTVTFSPALPVSSEVQITKWSAQGIVNSTYVLNGSVTRTTADFVSHVDTISSTTLGGTLASITLESLTNTDAATVIELTVDGKPVRLDTIKGNGFHLPFSNNSTAAALGTDTSGNSNTWTVNNISVTAGSGNDSLVDTPTNYGTDTGAGGEVRGNYCTWNPLDNGGNILSNGNLDIAGNGSTVRITRSTFALPTSGKWYAECELKTVLYNGYPNFGIVSGNQALTGAYTGTTLQIRPKGADSNRPYWVIDTDDASKIVNTTPLVSGSIIQLVYDADLGEVWMGINNIYYGLLSGSTVTVSASDIANGTNPAYILSSDITFFTCLVTYAGEEASINFGQRPFDYTAPSGFKALCTANLPTPTITDGSTAMDVVLYTGDGQTTQTVALPFDPGLTWHKVRSAAGSHYLHDAIRGFSNTTGLRSNGTNAEGVNSIYYSLSQSGSNLTFGDVSPGNEWNVNGSTHVIWTWDAGSSTVTNTDGSITSTVRANPSAGFSIVTYTGTLTSPSNETIGHGLGVAPSLVITKSRSASSRWAVFPSAALGANKYLELNSTAAVQDSVSVGGGAAPVPTSTVFYTPYLFGANFSGQNFVAYCFAPVDGYSSFGSYTGNGSADGPFVFTNMRPRWILIKRTDTTSNWTIIDTAREGYNVDNDPLFPNLSNAEGTTDLADILSNGFKLRTTDASVNANTGTYIYFAIAEAAFNYSRAR